MFVRRTSDSRPGSVFESRAAGRGAGPTISILIVVPTMTTVRSQLMSNLRSTRPLASNATIGSLSAKDTRVCGWHYLLDGPEADLGDPNLMLGLSGQMFDAADAVMSGSQRVRGRDQTPSGLLRALGRAMNSKHRCSSLCKIRSWSVYTAS